MARDQFPHKDVLGLCFVAQDLVPLDIYLQCPMWGVLASTLQCVILAGNPTEVFRSFLIVMKHINSNEELAPCFVCHSFLLPIGYIASIAISYSAQSANISTEML